MVLFVCGSTIKSLWFVCVGEEGVGKYKEGWTGEYERERVHHTHTHTHARGITQIHAHKHIGKGLAVVTEAAML